MLSKHSFHFLFFLVFLSFPFFSHVVNSTFIIPHFYGSFNKVYAFGDSYTDTGNAKLLGGVKKLSPKGQHGSSFGDRPSNGRLVVDFLCDDLNITLLPPYKSISVNYTVNLSAGVNFAIAGATVLTNNIFSHFKIINTLMWQGIPQIFQTQIEWYNKFVSDIACKGKSDDACKQDLGNGLFWLGQMGINDYARVLGSAFSFRLVKDMTIAHTSKLLTLETNSLDSTHNEGGLKSFDPPEIKKKLRITLLNRGAKYIVVQGLPPLGCYPFAKFNPFFIKDEMGCAAHLNAAVIAHNDLLQTTLEGFRQKHGGKDCMIIYADYFNAYKEITANLKKYGFEDAEKACCGVRIGPFNFNIGTLCGMLGTSECNNPASYVHWDGIHLTEAMHRQISNLFLHKGFCKPSFSQLIQMKKQSITSNTSISVNFHSSSSVDYHSSPSVKHHSSSSVKHHSPSSVKHHSSSSVKHHSPSSVKHHCPPEAP